MKLLIVVIALAVFQSQTFACSDPTRHPPQGGFGSTGNSGYQNQGDSGSSGRGISGSFTSDVPSQFSDEKTFFNGVNGQPRPANNDGWSSAF